MPLPRLALDRLPVKPGTARSVIVAAVTLVTAEFVRSGMYGAYFTQVIDTQYHLPVAVAGMVAAAHMTADTLMRAPAGSLIQKYGPRKVVFAGALLSLLALVVGVDDSPVTSAESLVGIIHSHRIGTQVSLAVVRDGKEQTIEATLGTAPASQG